MPQVTRVGIVVTVRFWAGSRQSVAWYCWAVYNSFWSNPAKQAAVSTVRLRCKAEIQSHINLRPHRLTTSLHRYPGSHPPASEALGVAGPSACGFCGQYRSKRAISGNKKLSNMMTSMLSSRRGGVGEIMHLSNSRARLLSHQACSYQIMPRRPGDVAHCYAGFTAEDEDPGSVIAHLSVRSCEAAVGGGFNRSMPHR